jgi:hypothetical protein
LGGSLWGHVSPASRWGAVTQAGVPCGLFSAPWCRLGSAPSAQPSPHPASKPNSCRLGPHLQFSVLDRRAALFASWDFPLQFQLSSARLGVFMGDPDCPGCTTRQRHTAAALSIFRPHGCGGEEARKHCCTRLRSTHALNIRARP